MKVGQSNNNNNEDIWFKKKKNELQMLEMNLVRYCVVSQGLRKSYIFILTSGFSIWEEEVYDWKQ